MKTDAANNHNPKILEENINMHQSYKNVLKDDGVFAVFYCQYEFDSQGNIVNTSGKINGTAFQINDSTVITANHVLNKLSFKKSPGKTQFWLFSRNGKTIIEIDEKQLETYPNYDLCVIKLNKKSKFEGNLFENLFRGQEIYNLGYASCSYKSLELRQENDNLVIDGYNISDCTNDKTGHITNLNVISSLNTPDVNLGTTKIIEVSFEGEGGMSGGPLLCEQGIVGMMSYVLPPASHDSLHYTGAIFIGEILSIINKK
jgi:V8-like Glu-specific endopeptidase